MFYVKLSTNVLNVHTLQTFEYQINNRKCLHTSSEMAKLCKFLNKCILFKELIYFLLGM